MSFRRVCAMWVFGSLGFWCQFAAHAEAPADILDLSLSQTGSTGVFAVIRGEGRILTDRSTGETVEPPDIDSSRSSSGGTLSWAVTRRWKDAMIDHEHVTYRQRYTPVPGSVTLPAEYAEEGIPMAGGTLTFHRDPEGRLDAVTGALYADVASLAGLALTSAAEAQAMAWWMLESHANRSLAPLAFLDDASVKALQEATHLWVYSSGNGRDFELVWKVPVITADGGSRVAALRGANGDLISDWDPNPRGSCVWQSNSQQVAVAVPQNLDISPRGVWATPSTLWPGYTHEAHFPTAGGVPHIGIYYGAPGDQCAPTFGGPSFAAESYTILPLPTEQGAPRYYEDRIARSAGDAILKTHLTMATLNSELGWSSFDGSGSPAKIVIEPESGSSCDGEAGNALFHAGQDRFAPPDSVVVCEPISRPPPQADQFEASACLDIIAHEWGHGVLFSRDFPYGDGTPDQRQLHEGFSDTLGYGVEWKVEDPGPAWLSPETADWAYGEDKNPPSWEDVRRVDVDDGAGNYSYHVGDPWGTNAPHYRGHHLGVAMYLAAEGGFNPVCDRMPDLDGCEDAGGSPVTQMPGATLEESIDKTVDVFWSVMVMYLNETDNWETVYSKAKFAAWELYRVNGPLECDEAFVEQHAIEEAFIAVGRGEVTDDFCECECGS